MFRLVLSGLGGVAFWVGALITAIHWNWVGYALLGFWVGYALLALGTALIILDVWVEDWEQSRAREAALSEARS